jgi:uncharacterized protein (DUF1330 family)
MQETYVNAAPAAAHRFFQDAPPGAVIMLNLLKFKPLADYRESPGLRPEAPVSGRAAYQQYTELVRPFLRQAGAEILFAGQAHAYLIGPEDEQWDLVLLVRYSSVTAFASFATSAEYQAVVGHRTAALEDSRLLPTSDFPQS